MKTAFNAETINVDTANLEEVKPILAALVKYLGLAVEGTVYYGYGSPPEREYVVMSVEAARAKAAVYEAQKQNYAQERDR